VFKTSFFKNKYLFNSASVCHSVQVILLLVVVVVAVVVAAAAAADVAVECEVQLQY